MSRWINFRKSAIASTSRCTISTQTVNPTQYVSLKTPPKFDVAKSFDVNSAISATSPPISVEKIDNPYSGEIVMEVPYKTKEEVLETINLASKAQQKWVKLPLKRRIEFVQAFIDEVCQQDSAEMTATLMSKTIGKPLAQARGEISTFKARAQAFIELAPHALVDVVIEDSLNTFPLPTTPTATTTAAAANNGSAIKARKAHKTGYTIGVSGYYKPSSVHSIGVGAGAFKLPLASSFAQSTDSVVFDRRLVREAVGVVSIISPWNYPLITTANVLIPALLAGNAVLLKASPRTPFITDTLIQASIKAGLPRGLLGDVFTSHHTHTHTVIAHPSVKYISFTGSVQGGLAVNQAVAEQGTKTVGLELGGNDAMYVAPDADIEVAAQAAVEGAIYNSGQSCCSVERIYVHEDVVEEVVASCVIEMNQIKLGDPMNQHTTMGPMALASSIHHLNGLVTDAISHGATVLIGSNGQSEGIDAFTSKSTNKAGFPRKARFFPPTLIINCNQKMRIAKEEAFGPIVAIYAVKSLEEAVDKINDSVFGLTSSIYTKDVQQAKVFAEKVDTGMVFMNRNDYVDPFLTWSGRKLSGKGDGVGLQSFHNVTKLKGLHFKLNKPQSL